MTVMFPPLIRLAQTRVCLVQQARSDMGEWRRQVVGAVRDGVGMVTVSGHGVTSEAMAETLSTARSVSTRMLVAAAEPCVGQVADAVHLSSLDHKDSWQGKVTGFQARTEAEIDASVEKGIDYIVVDAREPSLVRRSASVQESCPDFVWFVAGVTTLEDLKTAVAGQARRVWIDDDGDQIARWSQYLRDVWREDRATYGTSVVERARRRLL